MGAKEKKTYHNWMTGPYKSDNETANNAWTLIAGDSKKPSITRKQFLERIDGVMPLVNAKGQTVITPEAGQKMCELFDRLLKTLDLHTLEYENARKQLENKCHGVTQHLDRIPAELSFQARMGKDIAERLETIVKRAEKVYRQPVSATKNASGMEDGFTCYVCGTTTGKSKLLGKPWRYLEPNFCPHCGAEVQHEEGRDYEPWEEDDE